MKAWVLHKIGEIRLEERKRPVLSKGEVLVAIKAAGICGSDIPRIYQNGAYSYPLIPGHEFAGIVVETENSADSRWVGKKAGVYPLLPCGKCIFCKRKQFELCRNYSYLGSRRDGGFAEYAAVPADNLIELPEQVSFEEAAMLEPMAVAVHAIRQADISHGDRIGVWGLGTIGIFVLMFLLEAGVPGENILAIGNKEAQEKYVRKLGVPKENYLDGRELRVKGKPPQYMADVEADVLFECVGRNETLTGAITMASPDGKVVLVGNPFTDMCLEKGVYWKILRGQMKIKGSWNSSFISEESDDWHYVLKRLEERKISPTDFVSHRFSLDELDAGLHIMREKREDYGKIIVKVFPSKHLDFPR